MKTFFALGTIVGFLALTGCASDPETISMKVTTVDGQTQTSEIFHGIPADSTEQELNTQAESILAGAAIRAGGTPGGDPVVVMAKKTTETKKCGEIITSVDGTKVQTCLGSDASCYCVTVYASAN